MDNITKISLIHKIVQPYFKFELDDIYGDRGGTPYPKIKDLTELYFKKKTYNENKTEILPSLSKNDEQIMLNKIKDLNIGFVEIYKVHSIGKFIHIDMEIMIEDVCDFKYF